MEKRLMLAVTLSIIVMLVYPLFFNKTEPAQKSIENSQLVQKKEVTVTNFNEEPEEPFEEIDSQTRPEQAITRSSVSDKYEILLSNIGGTLEAITIQNGNRLNIDLVKNSMGAYGVLGMRGGGDLKDISSQLFDIKEDTNTMHATHNGLRVQKTINFLEGIYAAEVLISIKNLSQTPKNYSFNLVTASNISNKEIYESRYIGADILTEDGKFKRIANGNFKKYKELEKRDIVWLALKNKYYSIIAKPDFEVKGVFTEQHEEAPVTGLIVGDSYIAPGETKSYRLLFYIGPTEIGDLEKADQSFGKALNFGIFTSISLILLGVLKFFYGIFHNYGIAILLLTCCVSLLLFPLSFKSLRSMRKLQDLQPHMTKLREDHKDNPQKLNKEMMELYRRHKVNPMGGCLPMFLQMPVFIALYQTLMRSVELKGADFLWIKDLSMPDAAFALPFSIPFLGDSINLLPILMIGAMILQQKISGSGKAAAATDQQKMMGTFMPVLFGFIFYSLPSGLVLYWLTNTVLTSTLQFVTLKKS